MGHMATANINIKINDFVTGTMVGKVFSLLTLREMVNKLSTILVEDDTYKISIIDLLDGKHGKNSINVIHSYETFYLVINAELPNDNKEIETLADTIHEFFPYAEGTMLTIEEESYQPEITFFTRYGLIKDSIKDVKFEQNDKTVMPYVRAAYDDEITFEEDDILSAFIKNFLNADAELIDEVRKIVDKYVTPFAK
jgi:hypothetical protein